MRLTIVKSEWMEDWYLIERAEHNGREWIEVTSPHSSAFRRPARISDADVEGTASQMIDIGKAIEDRHNHSHKRCAVEFRDGSADREAEAHNRRITNSSHYDDDAQHKQRAERCEGRAAAFRTIADLLRGLS